VEQLDIAGYLRRIGHAGTPRPDHETLRALHRAHLSHMPFENLDIQMGLLPIRLDLASLQDKLVDRRRGGYCFEQNTLFLAVLERLGFEAAAFEARVRLGAAQLRPRTHMLIGVRLDGRELLADVGFGGQGPLEPVPMDGASSAGYRVVAEGRERVLQWRPAGGWSDLYAFLPEARDAVDFEVANHFTSTHPSSPFVQTLTAQLSTPEARYVLRNRLYTVLRAEASEERVVDDVPGLLRERFGLELPAGSRLRALETA
jgi:N-hydroxyarylamine O-acetyltransferase